MSPSPSHTDLLSTVESSGPPVDRRITRSRQAIGSALMQVLADGRPFSQVTVSEVAARAGLTRKTFYAHFDSTESVVRQRATELFDSVLTGIADDAFVLPVTGGKIGLHIFARLQRHLDELGPLAIYCPSTLFLEPAREAVESVLISRFATVNGLGPIGDFERTYLTHLASTTLLGTLTAWASRGFKDQPQEVAAIVTETLGPIADRILMEVKGSPP